MPQVIDSHVHLCGEPLNDQPPQTIGADGQLISFPCIRSECSVDCLLGHMDENSVDRAMVMGVEGWVTNEQLGKIVAQHSERLVGFAYISNPLDECRAPALLEHAVTTSGLRGLKIHPGLQGFSPSDPRLIPLIQKAAELSIPTLFHMHPWPIGNFDFAKPEHIYTLKKLVPDATLIIGHMAYQRFNDLLALPWYPTLYTDTSWGLELIVNTYGVDVAERIVKAIGAERILFGTDWISFGERMADELTIIDSMDLSQEQRQRILGGNAEEILEMVPK